MIKNNPCRTHFLFYSPLFSTFFIKSPAAKQNTDFFVLVKATVVPAFLHHLYPYSKQLKQIFYYFRNCTVVFFLKRACALLFLPNKSNYFVLLFYTPAQKDLNNNF